MLVAVLAAAMELHGRGVMIHICNNTEFIETSGPNVEYTCGVWGARTLQAEDGDWCMTI